jgi:hypothetical protein
MDYLGCLPNHCTLDRDKIIMDNILILLLWIVGLCNLFLFCDCIWYAYNWWKDKKETEKRITEGFFNYK